MDKYMLRSDFSLAATTWAASTAYKVDQLVYNDGVTYVCILAHTSAAADEPGTGVNEATYWQDFCTGATGAKGDTGDSGSTAFKGAWVTSTAYSVNDIVTHTKTGYGDQGYICTSAHTSGASTEPEVGGDWATKWTVIAGGGQDGAGSGDVTGDSGGSVTGNLVGFADTSGLAIEDIGTPKLVVDTVLLAETASTTAPAGTTDSLIVDENGTMKRKTADSFAKRTIPCHITAAAWRASATSGCGEPAKNEMTTNDMNIMSLAFGYASKTYACAMFDLPIAYDGGAIDAYVTWYSSGTTSNGVRFGLQLASIANDESFDASWGTAVEVTDNATGAAYKRLRSAILNDVTPSGTPAGGESLELRLYRDPAHGDDNLNEIIYITGVTLLIGMNKHSEG